MIQSQWITIMRVIKMLSPFRRPGSIQFRTSCLAIVSHDVCGEVYFLTGWCVIRFYIFTELYVLLRLLILIKAYVCASGVCTNATAPSVSSINRILRNRAAERAAAEFARAAGYGLYPAHPAHPYASFPWPPPGLWPVQGPHTPPPHSQALRGSGSPADIMPRLIGQYSQFIPGS